MKIYEVPNNTWVVFLEDGIAPPGDENVRKGDVLCYKFVDGMYALCRSPEGVTFFVKAWTQVQIFDSEPL